MVYDVMQDFSASVLQISDQTYDQEYVYHGMPCVCLTNNDQCDESHIIIDLLYVKELSTLIC